MPIVSSLPENLKTIHIMGIGGTAMAALAGMLVDGGYTVTGSDGQKVYPPMSTYLEGLGITPMDGYKAENLSPRPDLVIVGNVVRAVYEEAKALLASDIPYTSFPSALGMLVLDRPAPETGEARRSLVLAGTHGKTTTTTLGMWLLESAGHKPGFLVGGVASNFDRTARIGGGAPFVIEGDEYDTAFFDKGPKFLHYRPSTVVLTSIEFDHADIYRDLAHCQESFTKLMGIIPDDGLLVARMDHEAVAEVAAQCKAEVQGYGEGQAWEGRIESVDTETGTMRFTVLHQGKTFGTFDTGLVGEHNLWNQVAVTAALAHEGLSPEELAKGFASYGGVKRRQEVIGHPGRVTVVDDFAHHPTSVQLTLEALRLRFGGRRLWAIFEPRSNSSRRKVFQGAYAEAFGAADIAVIAPPPDMGSLAEDERLDPQGLVDGIRARGTEAFLWGDGPTGRLTPEDAAATIAAQVSANAMPEDVVAILSNGGFGGLHTQLLDRLAARFEGESA